jgi:signal transduction histidine kinase
MMRPLGQVLGTAHRDERLRPSVEASERERRRWAHELHDETLQQLGAVRLKLAAARKGPPDRLGPAVEDAIAELATEIGQLRALIAELGPVALDDSGLATALESLAHSRLLARDLQVDLDFSLWREGADRGGLDPELESTLFRVAQEALDNVAAHADVAHARMRLSRSIGGVSLTVADRGCGFDPAERSDGLGLAAMAERLRLLGGALVVETAPGAGTTVRARVPLQRGSESSRPRRSA